MSGDIVDRLRQTHTLQYGWRFGEVVWHTENDPDPNITERMNRCAVCEQWSPCDGRDAAAEIERLSAAGDALAEVADEWPELVETWQEARRER